MTESLWGCVISGIPSTTESRGECHERNSEVRIGESFTLTFTNHTPLHCHHYQQHLTQPASIHTHQNEIEFRIERSSLYLPYPFKERSCYITQDIIPFADHNSIRQPRVDTQASAPSDGLRTHQLSRSGPAPQLRPPDTADTATTDTAAAAAAAAAPIDFTVSDNECASPTVKNTTPESIPASPRPDRPAAPTIHRLQRLALPENSPDSGFAVSRLVPASSNRSH